MVRESLKHTTVTTFVRCFTNIYKILYTYAQAEVLDENGEIFQKLNRCYTVYHLQLRKVLKLSENDEKIAEFESIVSLVENS